MLNDYVFTIFCLICLEIFDSFFPIVEFVQDYNMQMLDLDNESVNSSTSSQDSSEKLSELNAGFLQNKEKHHRTPLNFFKTFKSKNPSKITSSQSPKKEYLRCKLIRGCKKCMRHLAQKKDPQKIAKFKKMSPKAKRIWEKMLKFHEENLGTLGEFSKTDTTLSDEVYKSYNSKFCSRFFENVVVRKLFKLYIKLLFVDYDLNRLAKEFNFGCCIGKHDENLCLLAWEELKNYILSEMVEEVLRNEGKRRKIEQRIEKKVVEMEKTEEIEQNTCKFSVMKCLDLQPKWIQRFYLMDLHII